MIVAANRLARSGAAGIGLVVLALALVAAAVALERSVVQTWWLVTVALGVGAFAASTPTAWRDAGFVATSWWIGFASKLALTQPLWFESYYFGVTSFAFVLYAAIALQAGVAATVIVQSRLPAIGTIVQRLGYIRLAAAGAILFAAGVGVMGYVPRHDFAGFARQTLWHAVFVAINLASAVALAMVCPRDRLDAAAARVGGWLSAAGDPATTVERVLPWLVAGFVLFAAATLNLIAFEQMPRLPDEVAYLFQAKTMAEGRLFVPVPVPGVRQALEYDWISMVGGKWFSIFPPGWPAVLGFGVVLGIPYLINPVLAAFVVVAGHALVTRVATLRLATISTLLLAASPWFIATAASLMSHVLTLALMLGAWLLIVRAREGAIAAFFVAGGLMGGLVLTRPLDGVVVGAVTGLWLVIRGWRSRRGWFAIAAYGAGCIVIGGLVFPYNELLTGNPLLTPIDQHFDAIWHKGANRLGFGSDIGPPSQWGGLDIWRGHTPLEALIQAQYNATSLNDELFGWGTGSLVLVIVHVVFGRLTSFDRWALVLVGATIATYGLYWFNGGFYIGPRYWFVTLWPLVYLSACGVATLVARLAAAGADRPGPRVAVVVAMMVATGVLAFLPWRGATRYYEHRGFHRDFGVLAAAWGGADPLVFVRSGDEGEFGSAFMLNSPRLAGTLFVRDRGASANAAVAAAFPTRPVVVVAGRTFDDAPHARVIRTGPPASVAGR